MPPAPQELIGQWLGEHVLTEVLGEGRQGIVYACKHGNLGSERACKVMHAAIATDEAMVVRFIERAQEASRLHHPNRVDVFDIGQLPDGRVFYVMERLRGATLATRLLEGPLAQSEVLAIAGQLCAALAAAHSQGVYGAELAPERVFLTEDQALHTMVVKLREPGAPQRLRLSRWDARGLPRIENTSDPHYLAPELIRGEAADARTDLYALGVLLFESATGRAPFTGKTAGAILRGHLRAAPPDLDASCRDRGFSEGFAAVVRKALAKDPADRYSSALALEADLLRIGRGERAGAESLTGIATPRPKSRVLRWAVPLVLGGLLGSAFVGWRVLGPQRQKDGAAERSLDAQDLVALRKQALRAIREGLSREDAALRKQAVSALARGRDPRLRDLIEPLLADRDPSVAQLAAETLARLGARGSIPELKRCIEGSQPLRVRVACGAALDVLGSDAGESVLRRALAEGDDAVRLLAALQLAEHGDSTARQLVDIRLQKGSVAGPDVALILERLLLRDDPAVRARADALLSPVAQSGDPRDAQLRIAAALLPLSDNRGRSELVTATEQPGPAQVLAAHLLCMAEDLYGQPLLRRVLSEAQRPMHETVLATTGLGGCGDKSDIARLAIAIDRPAASEELRQAQAGSLLRLCASDPTLLAEQSVALALNDIADQDPTWRSAAAAALGESAPEQSVPVLGRVLREDREPAVREQAARALGRTQAARALPELGNAVEDPNRAVRVTAMRSIGEVAEHLRRSGAPALDRSVREGLRSRLAARSARGDDTERVAAAGTLIRLGDESQRAALRAGLAARDPEAQRLAIHEAGADPELQKSSLPALLQHADPSVRLEAAKALAMAGQRQGVAVLREALSLGGEGALAAYGLLNRLGEQVAPPAGWDKLLSRAPAPARLGVVESSTLVPVDVALQILRRASRDADHTVRRRVVEILGELQLGSQQAAGLALLRRMQGDADAVVRALATALIARRGVEAARRPAPALVPAPRPQSAAEAPSQAPTRDGGTADLATPAETPGPESTEPAERGATAEGSPGRPQADLERLLQSGLDALDHKQLDKAERLLEKASAACARARGSDKTACEAKAFTLAYGLARVYEAQDQPADAMTEYEKAKKLAKQAGDLKAQQSSISRAMKRLAKGLGRVALPKQVRGRCAFLSVWMPPGEHSISLPHQTLTVRVRAGQTVKAGACP